MIKQIKPNSLSHKFLSLIFEKSEIRNGINICDVPWRLLKEGIPALLCCVIVVILGVVVLAWVVGLILAILAPVVDYNLFFANWAWFGHFATTGVVLFAFMICPFVYIGGGYPIIPKWIKGNTPNKEPSLLSIWWKSFKEKTCVKIVVADDVEEK